MKVTASNLVKAIENLPKKQWFQYPANNTLTKLRVLSVMGPEGPIKIERYNVNKINSGTATTPKEASISVNMLWRLANAIEMGVPIHIDRVFGASFNTRSALEALLAHTPEFYICYPGRIEMTSSTTKIREGHKHLLWLPHDIHPNGLLAYRKIDMTISELDKSICVYDAIKMPPEFILGDEIDIDVERRHIQIQLALWSIGKTLGYRTYIAKNDQGVSYKGKAIGTLPNVVTDLSSENLVASFENAVNAGKLIDCVWFKNGTLMPAVMEVEHSTGITSGLARMNNFRTQIPAFPTRWTIVAPDEDRNKVHEKANQPQFKEMCAKFFSYSAVEELYSLCQRRCIRGITDEFLDCFMEDTN